MADTSNRKLFSALGYLIFILAVIFFFTSNDEVVKGHNREAINFWLNIIILNTAINIAMSLFSGLGLDPLVFILFLAQLVIGIGAFVLSIVALVKVLENPDQQYRYPVPILRLIKDPGA